MRLRIFLIVLFAPLLSFSQTISTDSLREVLRTTKNDTARVNALRNLSMKLWDTDGDSSLLLLNLAITGAEKMKEPDRTYWMGIVNEDLGNYYIYSGDAVKALGHFTVSIACWDTLLVRGDTSKMGNYNHHKTVATGNLGQAYEIQGDYPKALDCYFLALSMWEKLGSKRAVASKCATIAIVYDAQSDSLRALEYYNKALALFQEVKDSTNTAKMYSNIGVLYFNQKNYTKALRYDSLALDMHMKKGNRRSVAVVLSNIGLVYQATGDNQTALDCYQRAKEIDIEVGNTRGQMIRLSNMGVVYTELGQYAKAEDCLLRALTMADSMRNTAVAQDVHMDLSDLYKATGRYELALKEFQLYSTIKDSLFNVDRDRDLARKEASYEYDQRTDSIKAAQEKIDIAEAADKKIAEETLKGTRLILFGFAGGFVLVLLLAFFIFRNYKAKKKAHIEISHQKEIIEEKNKDILDSIHYARRIQSALLASEDLLSKNLKEYFVLFKPKDIVSGDFYYATEKSGAFYLAVCDSTGHGVPGAFMSLLNIAYLNEAVNEQKLTSPDKIFDHTRNRLIENISGEGAKDGMDGILVRFDKELNNLTRISYAAAYNAPYMIRNGIGETLSADKMPVGKGERTNDFQLYTASLEPGSCLYLFTDGFADQFGGSKGKKMKRKTLEEKLLALHQLPMEQQKLQLQSFLMEWMNGNEQVDDILVVGIRL